MQVGAGITKALGLVFFGDGLEGRVTGVVAVGDDDALALGIVDQGGESIATGMAHNDDAIRLGSYSLFELIDHLLVIPTGILLDQFDVEGCCGGAGTVCARQRRAIARVTAHLHVDDELGAGGGRRGGGYHHGLYYRR